MSLFFTPNKIIWGSKNLKMPHSGNITINKTAMDNETLALFQNKQARELISAIYVLVTLVNLTGNGISMYLLLFRTTPKTPSIIFMINLTITDLALGCVLPFQINYLLNGYNWTLGVTMCNILTVVFFANMYCSILTMTAISMERYLGIVKPMRFRELRKKSWFAMVACALMWILVLVVLYPLETTDLTYVVSELGITTCFDVLKKDMLPSKTHWLLFLFGMFVILFLCPLIITVYCYANIIYVLVKNPNSNQKGRAIRLAFTVLFVFVVFFSPNNILLLAHTITRVFYEKSLYMAYKLSLSLSCINSCLDPFIYYFASKEFRRKLRQMLRLQTLSSGDYQTNDPNRESLYSRSATNTNGEGGSVKDRKRCDSYM
ncbi:P2Y purinoceptor 8 [Chanos chanos]|uniref:P2Y purinoceptor 8 n=1 Tax=Chanos chanos TaxID=29144 RepID=A0A6J2WD61_CHACN|nr:P2Y purinoceptor 8 [Chanos chanos]